MTPYEQNLRIFHFNSRRALFLKVSNQSKYCPQEKRIQLKEHYKSSLQAI
jgi:hypothetical protein